MKREKVIQVQGFLKVMALLVPLLLNAYAPASASTHQAAAVHSEAVQLRRMPVLRCAMLASAVPDMKRCS